MKMKIPLLLLLQNLQVRVLNHLLLLQNLQVRVLIHLLLLQNLQARPLLLHSIEIGYCDELVDPRLENHYEESKMIAAACICHSAPRRPRMLQVMRELDADDNMSDLSNGLRYGQSTAYDSGQYDEDIYNFRMSRFDSCTSEFSSGEPETRAFTSSFDRHRRSSSRGCHFR